jgi:glutathione S-transferase
MSLTIDGSTVTWAPPGCAQQDPPLVLWGIGTSRTFRAHWMLTELGLSYVSRRIQSRTGETMEPAFLKLNPRHKIPLLQHGALTVTESAAIIQYLAEQFAPPPGLFAPSDATARAKLNEWCYFIMSELDGHTLYVIRRHVGLKHLYGEAPTAVEAAKAYFLEQVEALQPQFRGIDPYLFGDRLSVADILLTSCLDWAVAVGIALPPATLAYRERTTSRPAYSEARRRNDAAIHPESCGGLPAKGST